MLLRYAKAEFAYAADFSVVVGAESEVDRENHGVAVSQR